MRKTVVMVIGIAVALACVVLITWIGVFSKSEDDKAPEAKTSIPSCEDMATCIRKVWIDHDMEAGKDTSPAGQKALQACMGGADPQSLLVRLAVSWGSCVLDCAATYRGKEAIEECILGECENQGIQCFRYDKEMTP